MLLAVTQQTVTFEEQKPPNHRSKGSGAVVVGIRRVSVLRYRKNNCVLPWLRRDRKLWRHVRADFIAHIFRTMGGIPSGPGDSEILKLKITGGV